MIEPLTNEKLIALLGPSHTVLSGNDAVLNGDQAADTNNDEIQGTGGGQTLRGHSGNDFLHAGNIDTSGDYSYWGRAEYVEDPPGSGSYNWRDEGADKLYGGAGNDVLVGGHGEDLLDGGPGNDYLYDGGLALNHVDDTAPVEPFEEWGSDVLIGGSGNDYLYAGDGNYNILNGGPGDDHLHSGGDAGSRFNILDGGSGNDYLQSEGINDVLIGGPGRDVFDVFGEDGDHVKILDFQDGVDRIKLGDFPGFSAFYNLAREAGIQWDMHWIATEIDNGVQLQLQDDDTLTILGTEPSDLQFEFVGADVFIV